MTWITNCVTTYTSDGYKNSTYSGTSIEYVKAELKINEPGECEMRDLKFRAWDREANNMMEDVAFKFNEYGVYVESHDYIGNFRKNRIEIMQFSGLKDSNGNDIYEGDILEWTEDGVSKQRGVVKWSDVNCGFVVTYGEDLAWFVTAPPRPMKIVGNIHESEVSTKHSLASA
ncbi:MAG: hypothetical protein GF372_07460 [Candidatus Marinimicrobia bacterium]|nr:hypothetical protein [Candidatus Neomarinimicrobiota bacterium]